MVARAFSSGCWSIPEGCGCRLWQWLLELSRVLAGVFLKAVVVGYGSGCYSILDGSGC